MGSRGARVINRGREGDCEKIIHGQACISSFKIKGEYVIGTQET